MGLVACRWRVGGFVWVIVYALRVLCYICILGFTGDWFVCCVLEIVDAFDCVEVIVAIALVVIF